MPRIWRSTSLITRPCGNILAVTPDPPEFELSCMPHTPPSTRQPLGYSPADTDPAPSRLALAAETGMALLSDESSCALWP